MKPISLTIAGLNSFEEAQTINFEQLTADGLFGIFGPTGSGKSTIVDAMTLALYGEMPRLQKEKRKEWINVSRREMAVRFVFTLGTDSYVAERKFKRVDDRSKAESARLYRIRNDQCGWNGKSDGNSQGTGHEVIADQPTAMNREIVQLMGLNYHDFTRSVVLPQGRFSEFLLLENKDRRMMLERIFRLEDYGEALNGRVREKASAVRNRLELVGGQISVYEKDGELTKEAIRMVNEQLKQERETLEQIRLVFSQERGQLEQLTALQDLWRRHEEMRKQEAELLPREPEIAAYEQRIRRGEQAARVIPLMQAAEDTTGRLLEIQRTAPVYRETVQRTQLIENERQKAFEWAAQRKRDDYPIQLKLSAAYRQALQIAGDMALCESERVSLLKRYQDQQSLKRKTEAQLKKAEEAQSTAEEALKENQKQRDLLTVDPDYRRDIENGVRESQRFQEYAERLEASGAKRNEWAAKQDTAARRLSDTETQLKSTDAAYYFTSKKQLDAMSAAYEQALADYTYAEEQMKQAHMAFEQARIRREFSDTAQQLSSGMPCPLCGATDHPAPATGMTDEEWHRVTEHNEALKASLACASEKLKEAGIKKRLAEAEWEKTMADDGGKRTVEGFSSAESQPADTGELAATLSELKRRRESLMLKQARCMEALTQSKAQYEASVNEYDSIKALWEKQRALLEECEQKTGTKDFESKRKEMENADRERRVLEKKEQKLQTALTQSRTKRDASVNALAALEHELGTVKAQGQEKKVLLEKYRKEARTLLTVDEAEADTWTAEDWHARAEAMYKASEDTAARIAEEEETAAKQLRAASEDRQAAARKWEALQESREMLTVLNKEQREKLTLALEENQFISAEEVKASVLAKNEASRLTKEAQAYRTRLAFTQRTLNELKERLSVDGQSPNPEDMANLNRRVEEGKEKIRSMEVEMDRSKAAITLSQEKLSAMETNYAAVSLLKKEREDLTGQYDLLSDLSDLFKGNAFVEYMAAGHLRYITLEASQRLKRMTGGRYALELDGPDFVMRDDYNGGIRRSPKTLSGGETFMAALCLALALSANIQLKNNAMLDFFFLDEGFGTLDPTVLDTVMTALEQLPRENMTVGVISHVEEMKQRIPRKLLVTPPQQGICGTKIQAV